ncbi:MAG: fused MFS/spermidine synthase [Candidatus Microgenomates bacterium]
MLGTRVLEERESKYNGNLRVINTFGMGTYIQADGLTQSGGIVETIWRQTIKKVKSKKPKAKNCLILGLGGGTVAKLIKKNWPEVRIAGIEIDPIMIELGKKYLGLDQLEVETKIGDAFQVNQKLKNEKFDLIIVDLYNGDKFPEKFGTENYIRFMRTILTSGGIVVFNRLYYGDKRPETVKFGDKLKKIFSEVEWFYPEANLMFLCSG